MTLEDMRERDAQLCAEIEKLKAIAAHAAGFLDGMAARIEGWIRLDNALGDTANFAEAVRDCRTMAASITNNMSWNRSRT